MARTRMIVSSGFFGVIFLFVVLRLADVMIWRDFDAKPSPSSKWGEIGGADAPYANPFSRQEILDCNGEVIATTLSTSSVYANPKILLNVEEAALKLSQILPDLDYKTLLKKLQLNRGFVWIARHISPDLQHAVTLLGLPGIYIQKEEKRVYPHGSLFSHTLGYCGMDNEPLAGLEKFCNKELEGHEGPLVTSLDLKAQHVVFDELSYAVEHYKAEGGNAIVIEIPTGKIRAMVSLPDFDPNSSANRSGIATFNRNTLGVYECGSVLKILNTAIALETKTATLQSHYDASCPIKIGRFKIDDFRGKYRVMDVQEGFVLSSNILHAKMALDIGAERQKYYLEKFGFMNTPQLELPELGAPILPQTWREITVMTIAYGYGISVSPLQVVAAMAGILNNGIMVPATLLEKTSTQKQKSRTIISKKTSQKIKDLMRLVVTIGTAKTANVPGYDVIGKTGTAHKVQAKGYSKKARITSFVGAFPYHAPRYLVLIMLDDPKPIEGTHGYATGGWNVAPTAGRLIARLAPLLGVPPVEKESAESSLGNFIDVGMR